VTIDLDKRTCPLPASSNTQVLLAHGGGGRATHRLLEDLLLPTFSESQSESRHDGAVLKMGKERIAFTTDSFVVNPLFFPGGDIGSLAVYGTVNDLAMCGARPLALSCALILEEGMPMDLLAKIAASLGQAAKRVGVSIVTGDTKVVDRGKGDQIYINTAGIGSVADGVVVGPERVRVGDKILLSGDIGRHGMAIMAAREGLSFESNIESDCAPLDGEVQSLLNAGIEVHCLRDLTRGGLASALVEIADASANQIIIDEETIAVREDVSSACAFLGFDPLYVANEGRFIAIMPAEQSEAALETLHRYDEQSMPTIIGEVTEGRKGLVTMNTTIGTRRVVDMLSGEQLPRIC
jgi:hydrogenase expression/formation protein HypE